MTAGGRHLDSTDHASGNEQACMICGYLAWRNRNTNSRLRHIVDKANAA